MKKPESKPVLALFTHFDTDFQVEDKGGWMIKLM